MALDKVLSVASAAKAGGTALKAARLLPFGMGMTFGLGLTAVAATGYMMWKLLEQSTWTEFSGRSKFDRDAADGESARMPPVEREAK